MLWGPSRVRAYRKLREELRDLLSSLAEHATRNEIWDVADRLGLVRKDRMVVDEMDLQTMQDVLTAEIILPDPARFERIAAGLPSERRRWLEVVRDSCFGIYEIVSVTPSERVVVFEDRLREGRYEVTDIHWSATAQPRRDILMSFRLLSLEGFVLTTGVAAPVPADRLGNVKGALEHRLRRGQDFKKAMYAVWCTAYRRRFQSPVAYFSGT